MRRSTWLLIGLLVLSGCGGPEGEGRVEQQVGQVAPPQPPQPPDAGKADHTPRQEEPAAGRKPAAAGDKVEAASPPVVPDVTGPGEVELNVDDPVVPTLPAIINGEPEPYDRADDEPIDAETGHLLDQGSRENIEPLLTLLKHEQAGVRSQAARRLRWLLDEDAAGAVPALVEALSDPSPTVRCRAAEALGSIGAAAAPAAPALAGAGAGRSEEAAEAALFALKQIGPEAAAVVPALIRIAAGSDSAARQRSAIQALGAVGPQARSAIPTLAHILQGEAWGNREAAAEALGQIGAVEQLLARLEDPDTEREAAHGLGYLPKHDDRVVNALAPLVRHENEYLRERAVRALGMLKPTSRKAAEALILGLQDEEADVRIEAALALHGADPKFDSALPHLLKASQDENEYVRNAATRALGGFKGSEEARLTVLLTAITQDAYNWHATQGLEESTEEFYPLLVQTLQDKQQPEALRAAACMALWVCRENRVEEVTGLMLARLLDRSETVTVRSEAATVLRWGSRPRRPEQAAAWIAGLERGVYAGARQRAAVHLGMLNSAEGVPALVAALRDASDTVSRYSADALGDLGEHAAAAVPALIELAQDAECNHRVAIVFALGDIGKRGELSAPVLMAIIKEGDERSPVLAACKALAQVTVASALEPQGAVDLIAAHLDHERSHYRNNAADALAILGPAAAPVVARLIGLLDDDNTQEAAVKALGSIGPAAEPAVDLLAALAADPRHKHRAKAVESLGHIARRPDVALPPLIQALNDAELQRKAIQAIAAFGAEGKAAIPPLLTILEGSGNLAASDAADALGAMGPAGRPALVSFQAVVVDEQREGYVRAAAAEAMMKIAPDDPQVIPTLLALPLDDRRRSAGVREKLIKMGPAIVPHLEQAFKSDDPAVRRRALSLLTELADDRAMRPVFLAALDDGDLEVRLAAALQLNQRGGHEARIIPILIDGLSLQDHSFGYEVNGALRRSGKAAVPALAAMILDPSGDAEARREAAAIVAEIQSARGPNPALAPLVAGLRAEDGATRIVAALALSSSPLDDPALAAALLEGLQADDPELRRSTGLFQFVIRQPESVDDRMLAGMLHALGDESLLHDIGSALSMLPLSAAQLDMLLPLLADEKTRQGAALTLSRGRFPLPETFIAPLAEAVRSDDEQTAHYATSALGRIGPAAAEVLLEVVADGELSPSARTAAGAALRDIYPPPVALMPKLEGLLQSDSQHSRWVAAVALAHWGSENAELHSQLTTALTAESDWDLRYSAEQAFVNLGAKAAPAVPGLLDLLDEGGEEQERAVGRALVAVAPESQQIAGALMGRLKEHDDPHRWQLVSGLLKRMGPTGVAALIAESDDADHRHKIFYALSLFGPAAAEAVPLLRAALEDPEEAIRVRAAHALAIVDHEGDEALPVVLAALESDEKDLRSVALEAVQALGPRAKTALPILLAMLQDEENRQDAEKVIAAIGSIGPEASQAVPELIKRFNRSTDYSHYVAGRALREIGPAAAGAVSELVEALNDTQRMHQAILILAAIGPEAQAALPVLTAQLRDEYRREEAAAALGQLGETAREAVPVLARGLQHPDADLALACAESLGSLGPVAAAAASELLAQLQSSRPGMRAKAARSLGQIGALPEQAVPALAALLDDPSRDVRFAAIFALSDFKGEAKPAAAALVPLLADDDLRIVAIDALGSIGPAAGDAVGPLVERLGTGTRHEEYRLTRALANIGPEAASAAVPKLVELLDSPSRMVVDGAAAALWKLDPAAAKKAGARRPPESDEHG